MKICFKCKKEIQDKENYFVMIEMNNEKKIKKDYVHKICWNTFLAQLNGATASLQKSNYLLNKMGNYMKKVGILPEDEVKIC